MIKTKKMEKCELGIRWKAKHGLTLKWTYKDQTYGLRDVICESSLFWRRGGEKNRENLGFARKCGLGWLCCPLIDPKRPNNIQKEI